MKELVNKSNKFKIILAELKRTGFISLSLIAFLYAVNAFYTYEADFLVKEKATIEAEVATLNSQLNEINTKSAEIKEAVALWKTLNQNAGTNTGLKIDEAKNSMAILKEKYLISDNITINLTPPQELTNAFKTDKLVVVESEVEMHFSGISDLLVLNFIDQFTKELSGFTKITELRITKSQPFTDALVPQIQKGNFPKLVEANLKFYWRDLKDIR